MSDQNQRFEKLQEERLELVDCIASIQDQLALSKLAKNPDGEDKDWKFRAAYCLKKTNQRLREVKRELAQLRAAIHKNTGSCPHCGEPLPKEKNNDDKSHDTNQ